MNAGFAWGRAACHFGNSLMAMLALAGLTCVLLPSAAAADFAVNDYSRNGADIYTQTTAVDAIGNSVAAGYFSGETATFGSITLARIGTQDAFVVKRDANGTVLWAKNFGGSGAYVYGKGIAVDGSGNVYLGGYFVGTNLTNPALTKIGTTTDAFALKLDSNGNTAWAKNFGGLYAQGNGIAVDGSGNVYLGGYFLGANLTNPALTKIGDRDAFVLKLDSSGNTAWAKNFGGSGAYAYGQSIAVNGSGNVYLGGTFQNANLTTPALSKIGTYDAFVLKLDSSGNTAWAKNFGGSGAAAFGNGIAVDGSGNVYLGGYQNGNLTTPALSRIGGNDAFALKLDSSGNTAWAKNFGGSGGDAYGQGIAVDGSGNVTLGGYFQNANLTTPALTKIGNQDAFAFKLNGSDGSVNWSKSFGGTGASAFGQGIAADGSGNVYLGGYFGGANLTTPALSKIGGNDAFALKLDSNGNTSWSQNSGGFTSGGFVITYGTAVDAAGNSVAAGTFSGDIANFGSITLRRIGTQDAFVVKRDANGTALWAKNFGGSGAAAFGNGIAVDGSGNVYLGGTFQNANLTTPALSKIGTYDAFALKLDSGGNTAWAKNFGGSGADAYGQGIAVDGSGNVTLGGYFQTANLTTPALSKIGVNDAFALMLDSSGNTAWAKNFGGSGAYVNGKGVAVDGTGNVYLDGTFQSANLTTPALTKIGDVDAFALKLDSGGNTAWAKNFGGSGAYVYGNGIAADGSGNVYLGGYFQLANLTTPALSSLGNYDAFVFKLDSSGNTAWAKNFGGSGAAAYGQSIAVDGSGNVLLGGTFNSANLTTPALTKIGNQDAFAFKLNGSDGSVNWSKSFGGTGASAFGQGIAADGSGNAVLGGYFQYANLTTPALTKIGNQDGFLISVNANVPGAPTIGTATAGNTQGTVTFTTPGGNGGFAITSYTATSNPSGVTGTCANSPCTVMGLTNGTAYTFTVTATNAAGTGAASAASNSVTPMAPQIITFANPGTQTFGTSPTLTASASSGLAVSFSSSTTGVCTITTGGTLTFVTTGNCDISVGQTGNGAYTAAPTVTQSFTVNAASQTITFGAAPTIVFGASGMVTATGGGSNNPIVFTSTTTGVCTIAGNVVTGVSVGACIIAANQANSANYAAAPQVTLSFNISASVPGTPTIGTATAGNTQATVSFTTPGSNGGSAITGYTATSSPSGVTGTCANSPCTVMGLTNSTAYTFTVTATNIAGTGGASAASNSVTPKSPQTIIFANPGTQTFGTSPTLTASASSGLAVSFSSSLFIPNYCTITTGGTLTFLGAGGCAIRADQAGNGVYTAASTVQQNFYIEPASQTITFGAAPNVVVGGTGMVSATGGGSNNPIVFWSVFSNICTVEGTVVTGVAVGTCLIVANQAYSANYAAATQVPLFFNIDAASQNITFGAAPTVFVGGTGMVTATGGGSNNPIVFTSTTTGICTIAGNVVTGVSVGGCIIAANQASSVNYVAAPQATLSFNIDPPPIAFTGNAYSRKTHGNGIGVQDLPLLNAPINGAFTVEPRIAGSGHQIVFRFTNTVTSVTGVSITDASSVAVGNPVIGFFGNDLVLTLGGIGDMTRVTVSVTGVNGFVGLNASRTVGFLVGDMNGSRAVTAADIAGIKSRKGITIDNSNFQFDINLSGAIDNADVSVAKARSAQVLP